MAHFAKLSEDDFVLEINVVNNDVLDPENEEQSGIEFLHQWSGNTNDRWIQVSYNGNLYNKFPQVGSKFLKDENKFIDPRPYLNGVLLNSWILDENDNWIPPTPEPEDGVYVWNESTVSWDEAPFEVPEGINVNYVYGEGNLEVMSSYGYQHEQGLNPRPDLR